ncbi:MAG: peptidase [Xanthobacteraceae bacterium]|nr:MAG: peptidase [Xanthobacteraceae bacterium]
MVLDILRLLLFPTLVAFAAASDLVTMTISNRVSLLLAAGFIVLALAGGMGLTQMAWHAAAGIAVLTGAFALFALGWIGGGDAKLAAATALWLGFDHLLNYLLYASLFGGALTVFIISLRVWPLPAALGSQAWLQRLHDKTSGIPYGVALAAAALMVYPNTPWMKAVDLARLSGG